jgi:hypothetical protein
MFLAVFAKGFFPNSPWLYFWLTIPLWNILFTSLLMIVWSLIENAVRGRNTYAGTEGYTVGTFPSQVKPYLAKRVERINERGECIETDIPYYGTEGIPWYKGVAFWGWIILIYLVVWTIYWW